MIKNEQRFWDKVIPEPTSGCWLWTGATERYGHGQINKNNTGFKSRKAHRVSWQIHNGDIPKGMQINHKCHVSSCVNPNHLYVGTQKENVHDCIMAGRNYIPSSIGSMGEKNYNSKISDNDRKEICEWYKEGTVTQEVLAMIYGLHQTAISCIIRDYS